MDIFIGLILTFNKPMFLHKLVEPLVKLSWSKVNVISILTECLFFIYFEINKATLLWVKTTLLDKNKSKFAIRKVDNASSNIMNNLKMGKGFLMTKWLMY